MNNPGYIQYEQRERHAVIDQVRHDSLEALRTPEIARRLGDRTLQLDTLIQQAAVPNIHHGVITATHDGDAPVELTALHPSERTYRQYEDMSFNTVQRDNLQEAFPGLADFLIDIHDKHYSSPRQQQISALEDVRGAYAFTFNPILTRRTTQGSIRLQGRPLVILNASQPTHRHPAITLHELMHAQHANDHPVINPHMRLTTMQAEDELEAYHVSAQVIRGQRESTRPHTEMLASGARDFLMIDTIRERYQRTHKHPFKLSKAMLAALYRANCAILAVDDRYASEQDRSNGQSHARSYV